MNLCNCLKMVNPLGIKGVGEIGIVGLAAAIANAVYDATGKRVRDLPITLDKLQRWRSTWLAWPPMRRRLRLAIPKGMVAKPGFALQSAGPRSKK
jgi:hypothetical protein